MSNQLNLRERCKSASLWVVSGAVANQAMRMVRILIVTWILAPEQMALWFMFMVIFALLQELSDTGVRHALIQNPRGLETQFLHSAWLLNLIRNLLLILVLYIAAPFIATFYSGNFKTVGLVEILRLGCLILLFDGLASVSLTLLRKQLAFKNITLITIIANTIGLITAVFFTWKINSVKGIVIGEICYAATLCGLSYWVHPYRPRIAWHTGAARELLGYGLMIYLVSLVDAIGMRLDILILDHLDQSEGAMVGLYGLGMIAMMGPTLVISNLNITIGFPALSMIQNDPAKLKRAVTELSKITLLIAIPIYLSLFVMAPDIVRILPQKYHPTGDVLRWLSLFGFFVVFLRLFTPVLYAVKRVHWCLYRGLLQIILIAVLLGPMYNKWQLTGLCWAINISMMISSLFIWLVVLRHLRWSPIQWFRDVSLVWRPLTPALLTGALIYGVARFAGYAWSDHTWLRITACSAALAAYLACWLNHQRTASSRSQYSESAKSTRRDPAYLPHA
ncbi:MAG: oligosaccharide flippase family protein, partial [Planctomycetes bacterium]|nr:oligosaccharide flippase family protein [Planctomycetota bacterium]